MKKQRILLAVIFSLFALASCSKKAVTPPPMTYSVTRLNDVIVSQYAKNPISVPIVVSYVSGTKDTVTLTTESTTDNVTISPASVRNVPDFTANATLVIAKNVPGTYPVNIKSSAKSTTTQTHSFNLVVTADPDCLSSLAGKYSGSAVSNKDGNYMWLETDLDVVATSDKKIIFPISQFGTVTATVDCASGVLTVLPTSGSGYGEVIEGNGTCTGSSITVNFTFRFHSAIHSTFYYDEPLTRVYTR